MTAAADRTHERECMAQPQLQDLLEAGVHFGHQTRRWNPKMRRFIFAERSGIYIIDLQKTLRQIETAQDLLRGVVLKGENVLFVCTKKQLKNILQVEAQRCGAFYVTERWLGGTLTNFQTIKKQIKRLKELDQGTAEGERSEEHTSELQSQSNLVCRPLLEKISSDGSGAAQRLTDGKLGEFPYAFSPDGKRLVFVQSGNGGNQDIFTAPVEGPPGRDSHAIR